MVDLRSDTVTRPTPGMLEAIVSAEVGDDVFGDDPTVHLLEEKMAGLFGMEAAIFCPSGTMTNQIAVKVHTEPGHEVICDESSHIYRYEGGGIAFNSGVSVRLIHGDRGRITSKDIQDNINANDVHQPVTSMVSIENTCNKGGGSVYDFSAIEGIRKVCTRDGLMLHLDGARLFNAIVKTGAHPVSFGKICDSISICLSKGLGAPVGSVLIGKKEFITKARRIRKVMGGAMRQAGYLAAAGIYATENHVDRLKDDHTRAHEIEEVLGTMPYVQEIWPVETNIIVFKLISSFKQEVFINKLAEKEVLVVGFGPQTIRMVTHLDIHDQDVEHLRTVLKKL
ncbi:MAG: PLP-dependent transferase [Bacteroidales bacterium]|nr:MAG: PLP-dependent transferase [Bacteroidales bacterium]